MEFIPIVLSPYASVLLFPGVYRIYIYFSLFFVNMGCVDSFEKETPRRAGFNEHQQSMF